MSIQRTDHQDGGTTFASPLHEITVPPAARMSGPAEPPPTEEELARRERMRIVQVQAGSIPDDGNIGPSRHGGPTSFNEFQRRLVTHGLRATWRNLDKLRETDDDPRLGRLALEILAWEEELRQA